MVLGVPEVLAFSTDWCYEPVLNESSRVTSKEQHPSVNHICCIGGMVKQGTREAVHKFEKLRTVQVYLCVKNSWWVQIFFFLIFWAENHLVSVVALYLLFQSVLNMCPSVLQRQYRLGKWYRQRVSKSY